MTGEIRLIELIADNIGAFKGVALARFIASCPELVHIRTRAEPPSRNGVREGGFGSLKYEHLFRVHERWATVEGRHRTPDPREYNEDLVPEA